MKQSVRDVVAGEVSIEYFVRRFSDGWKLVSIEWFRDAADGTTAADAAIGTQPEAIPYGLRISGSGVLEENPLEMAVLLLILEQIIREKRIQEIAAELNLHGYATRAGRPWGPTDVFNLLPRLIEAGPGLLKSAAWQERRAAASGGSPRPQ